MESVSSAHIRSLYGDYRRQVFRRARQLLGHEQEAEDATQEVFLRLIDADARMMRHPEPLAWLLRVTTNFCLNRLRDDTRRRQLLALNKPVGNEHGDDIETRIAVTEIVTRVPDNLQQIGVYYHAGGMTCDELATQLGVSPRTIGNRLVAFHRLASKKALAA
jgi:RNA polymerase sigma-70 factor, ECF subfamily